jgi:hypothetical protein
MADIQWNGGNGDLPNPPPSTTPQLNNHRDRYIPSRFT